jgi:hypothetical protein
MFVARKENVTKLRKRSAFRREGVNSITYAPLTAAHKGPILN